MAANDVRVVIGVKDEFTPTMTQISALATTAFVGMGAAALAMAANFEQSIDQVGAVAGATAGEMEQLRSKALQLGADTSKSAGQAAEAMQILAASGMSATDILNGAADAAVALSEAGGTSLATAADTAATSMAVWGLATTDLTNVVNTLAGAANQSRFGVEDMSQAIAQGGGAAAAAGVDFNDFATAIAATANNFSSGSDAGTSFKTFLQRLAAPTKEAASAMKDLGISAFDADGNMKSMADIVQSLHDALAPLDQQARAAALAIIFGADAMRTAAGLAKLTGDEFATMSSKMKDTSAVDVAATRMGNLKGGVEELKGSLETMMITIGDKLIPAATGLTGFATTAVNAFGSLDDSTITLGLALGGLVTVLPLVVSQGENVIAMFTRMSAGTATAATKVGLVTAGLSALVIGADVILQKTTGHGLIETLFGDPQRADQLAASTAKMAAEIKGAGSGTELAVIAKNAREIAAAWDEMVKRFGDPNDRMYAGIISTAEHTGAFLGAVDALVAALSKANAPLSEYQRVMETLPEPLRAAFAEQSHLNAMMVAAAEAQAKAIEIITQLPPAMTAVATKATAAKGPIQAYVDSLGGGEDAAKNLAAALDHLADRFSTFNPGVIAAKIELAAISEELDDAAASGRTWSDLFGTSIDALKSRQKDLEAVTKAADSNATAFKGIADQLQNLIGAGGVGALDQAMQGAGKTLEQQVTTMEQIGLAFGKIATNDIPGIEKAFAALKTNLTQQEWGVVGDALAAKFVDGFYNRTVADQQRILEVAQKLGVQLPTAVGAGLRLQAGQVAGDLNSILADALIAAGPVASAGGSSIGSQMGAGIAAGLAGSTGIVAPAAASLVQAGLDAARRAMRIFSPSRVMADQVGKPMAEGIAAGLIEGAPAVGQAMQAITLMALGAWGGSRAGLGIAHGAFDGGIIPNSHPYNPWGQFGASDALGGTTTGGSWGTMPGLGGGNPDLSQFHLTPADFLRPWAGGDGSVAGSVFSQWRGPAPMSREQLVQQQWQQYSGVDPSAVLQLQFMRDAGIADTFGLYQFLPTGQHVPPSGLGEGGPGPGGSSSSGGGVTVNVYIQNLVGNGGMAQLANAIRDELVKVYY